jgi:hypothetical protein
MTDRPPGRKSHVTRILGKSKNPDGGDPIDEPDVYLDIERMETVVATQGQGPGWQQTIHGLKWFDDPNDEQGGKGNPARDTTILKICPPDDNPDDPALWVPVPVTDKWWAREGDQGKRYLHQNTDENVARSITVLRITHKDTNQDDNHDFTGEDRNPPQGGVIASDQYERLDGTEDKDDYVEQEFITDYQTRTGGDHFGMGNDQTLKFRLDNDFLKEAFDATDTSSPPINPPWRLDPFQNIVNVQFFPTGRVVLVFEERQSPEQDARFIFFLLNSATGAIVTSFTGGFVTGGDPFPFTFVEATEAKITDKQLAFIPVPLPDGLIGSVERAGGVLFAFSANANLYGYSSVDGHLLFVTDLTVFSGGNTPAGIISVQGIGDGVVIFYATSESGVDGSFDSTLFWMKLDLTGQPVWVKSYIPKPAADGAPLAVANGMLYLKELNGQPPPQ